MTARGLVAGLCAVAAVAVAARAHALPVFARRYQTSCTTCHTQFARLTPFGEAFRRNGYQFPAGADNEAIQQAQLKVVADARRELFPRSFWPSDLPNYVPLTLVLDSQIPIFPDPAVRPVGQPTISLDKLYGALELLAAARLGRNISIWVGAVMASDGGIQPERAFLTFSNLFRPSVFNLRIGQFEPQVFSFSNYRRNGGPSYQILSSKIDHSQWSFDLARGLDFSGTIAGRFGYNAAYVQGVEGSYASEGIRQVPRDGYLHLYFKLGGMRLDGVEPANAAPADQERSVQIGGFFYAGEHDVDVDNDRTKPPELDVLYRTGGDLFAIVGNVELLFAGTFEAHQFKLTGSVSRTLALGEISWRPLPWLSGILRAEIEASGGDIGAHLSPIICVMPRINLKVQLWGQVERQLGDRQFHFTQIDIVGRYAF